MKDEIIKIPCIIGGLKGNLTNDYWVEDYLVFEFDGRIPIGKEKKSIQGDSYFDIPSDEWQKWWLQSQKDLNKVLKQNGLPSHRLDLVEDGVITLTPISCSHEDLQIKTMELSNNELLLTIDCNACGKRTSTSASLNQGWEAEDLNTWAKQELSSHGQNVSFKNWAKKEVKSHGNIDLVDWAKHEEKSHKERYGAEENYVLIGTMQSTPADGYNGYMKMMRDARRLVEIGNMTGLDQKLGEAYQDESGRWFLPILERKASESFSLDSKKADSINMEEPVIEEPSFIPDGDGRAIGQQNSSINLSPLHAESGLVDINYDAKIRLNNPKDAKYITPSIEEGMDFENGEGVLSSKTKIDLNAETFGADYSFTGKIKKYSFELSDGGKEYVITYGGRKIPSFRLPKDIYFHGVYTIERFVEELNQNQERAVSDVFNFLWNKTNNGHLDDILMNRAESEAATYSPSQEPDMVNEIQTSPTNESPQLFNASNTFNTTTALGIGGLVLAALSLPMLYSSAKSRLGKSAEEKRKASGSVRKNHTQIKNSEYSVGQVNPVEAEGQQDIHGAEGITNPRHIPSPTPSGYPSKTLKMW